MSASQSKSMACSVLGGASNPPSTSLLEREEQFTDAPVFFPPVYRQRYEAVIEYVSRVKAQTVLDMGCAECKLLMLLVRSSRCSCITQLAGVDIQRKLLESKQGLLRPLTCDYLSPRANPLTISLYAGSIAQPDRRFRDWDVVSCIEVIEHLDSDVLADVPEAIFGHLRPRAVLISTPNADFNVLFKLGEGQFRHFDHRFEWTRAEFVSWCRAISERYGYSVVFNGIGAGPAGTEDLGCCSQMAVFERIDPLGSSSMSAECNPTPEDRAVSARLRCAECVHRRESERLETSAASTETDIQLCSRTGVDRHPGGWAFRLPESQCMDERGSPADIQKQTQKQTERWEREPLLWVSYDPVAEVKHPHQQVLSRGERLLNEATYCFFQKLKEAKESNESSSDCFLNEGELQWCIPLAALTVDYRLRKLNCVDEELRQCFAEHEDGYLGLSLSADGTLLCLENVQCSRFDDDNGESDSGEPCLIANEDFVGDEAMVDVVWVPEETWD